MKTKKTTIEKNNLSRKIKKLLLFLMFTLIIPVTFETTTLFAQNEFLAENQKQQVYYDSLLNVLGADSMQGTGYTQYKRWYRYWAPKLSANYDFDDYQNDLLTYANNYNSPQGNGSMPNWKLIGPNDIPVSGQYSKGTGQIHYIYKDPNDETGNTIYACSPVGGLFKSTNNGDTWFNLGTDKGLPRSGVSSVIIDNKSPSNIYITTGNGEGFEGEIAWQTAIGVWRSSDNGENWENIGLKTDSTDSTLIYHMRKAIEIKANPDSTFLIVTTTKGLFGCKNANKQSPEWEELIDGEFYDVVQDPVNNELIYASGSNSTGIFKYDLSNDTKTKIFDIDTLDYPYDTIEFPKLRRISIKISQAFQDSTYLFALVSMRDNDFTTIYRYNLASENWHRFHGDNFPNGYARKLGWAIRPELNDSSQIQILGQNANPHQLFYNGLSNDNESKVNEVWDYNSSDVHDDFHYLFIEDDNKTIWAGTDGGVYKGEFISDTLIEWIPKNKGLGVATIEFMDAKYGSVTSGQFDCGSNTYWTDDEINWTDTMKMGGDGFQTIITGSNSYYMSRENGHINFYQGNNNPLYFDIGKFISCKPPFDTLDHANFATYYLKLQDNLYAAGQKEVMRYNNISEEWEEWSKLETQIGCAVSGTWRVAAKDNNGTHQIYASAYQEPGDYQHLYKSIGGGGQNINNWVKIDSTPIKGWMNAIEISGNTDSVIVAIKDSIFSVNTNNPANPNWHDMTYNLDAGTINSIYRDEGKTWVGTERGVYYLNEDDPDNWVNYSTNLPNCEVKDIKVNDSKVYAGTYGRGVWFAGTPGCGDVNDYDTLASDREIALGIVRKKPRNIYIPTGKTLTVYGVLKMGADCRIIVERGAKLIVDGGTITNLCPDFWQGIEVRGNNNAAQVPANQGWVTLLNGATIEYAKQGAVTIKYENNAAYLSYAGGVVQSDSAFFKNNLEDVVFFPYPVPYPAFPEMNNKSYFKNTTFVTDSNFYYFSDQAVNHITLEDVKGVLFENNLFANTADVDLVNDIDRGIGIISWDAGFIVRNADGQSGGNVFYDLYYGIKAFAFTNNNELIEIDSNTFNHNRTACYLGAETNAVVIRNQFNVTTSGVGLADGYSGLYLDACTGYQVEENEFYSNYNPLYQQTYSRSYGLVINNSGPEDNEIYNNYFHNIGNATTAQEINRSKDGTGLTIKCNDYQDNYQDINVSSFEAGDQYGIKPSQGSNANLPNAPAGNTFSHISDTNNITSDYSNACANITYWHHFPNLSGAPYVVPVYSTPFPKINKTMIPNAPSYQKSSACPPRLENRSQGVIRTDIAVNISNEEIYVDSLDLVVDDGNTSAMNLDVTTSIPPETMELRDQLLDASPYLSDTVMANAAAKEDVLPNSIITEVLTANPQSAKSEKVLNKLDERDNPPNENQMASIHANDTIIGHKESIESKRAYYAGEKARTVYELSRFFMQDTTGLAIHDSIATALTNIPTLTSRYLQAFCSLNSNDSLGVINLLNNIPYEFDLDDAESDYNAYFSDYFDVLLELQSQDKNTSEIDSAQKADVYDIMNNTGGLLHAYARNLLIYTDGLEYHEPYLFPDTSSNKSATVKEKVFSHLWDEQSYFKLYPNPADGYITLEYNLEFGVLKPVVEVVSIDGVHVGTFRLFNRSGIKIIDLRDWQSGTYLLRLIESGKTLQNEKFIKY